jgi:hypothetical protein
MLWNDDSTARPRTISAIAHRAALSPPEKRDVS